MSFWLLIPFRGLESNARNTMTLNSLFGPSWPKQTISFTNWCNGSERCMNISYIQYTVLYSGSSMGTSCPVLETKLSQAEHCSAIHRKPWVFMNIRLPLIGWEGDGDITGSLEFLLINIKGFLRIAEVEMVTSQEVLSFYKWIQDSLRLAEVEMVMASTRLSTPANQSKSRTHSQKYKASWEWLHR